MNIQNNYSIGFESTIGLGPIFNYSYYKYGDSDDYEYIRDTSSSNKTGGILCWGFFSNIDILNFVTTSNKNKFASSNCLRFMIGLNY